MINSYFDLNSYDDPIKTFIEDRLVYYTINGFTRDVNFYFQKNEIERQDNYLSVVSEGEEETFISMSDSETYLKATDGINVFKGSFLKSNKQTSYTRSVFTFLDLLGVIGGVFEVLSAVGSICVMIFAERNFNYSILSNLYHV